MNAELERDFRAPGSWFRGMPFWAWNGALSPIELRRQIRLMKRMGLGGFFMHSRVGLATPYLQDEWFRCVEACADEAKKQGMLAWMYDEDRWPSGAAGGLVTKDPRWRRRSLGLTEITAPAGLIWSAATVAAFTARVSGVTATRVAQIPRGKKPASLAPGETILAFRVVVEKPSDWHNGATYLDTLNPAAVKRFIAVTHEAYRERMGRHFGKSVPGMFTDEPNHGHTFAPDSNTGDPMDLPWTGGLPAAFRARYGYDLVPRLVELYFDVDGQDISRARHDYHDCVTALFVDAFARQVGEWCEENGLLHIGHVLMEDTLSEQADVVGSAMRFYEHMQAPGMDLISEYWRAFTTAKQVSSVAHQIGRMWRLSEHLGATGWDFSCAGHKALGDWQAALGITLRCQHLAWYTMEGEAKRDYPAAVSPQSPWWELYPAVEDYFGRVNAVMTRGEEVRDILVVHPVESTWTMIRRGWKTDRRVRDYDRALIDLEDTLLGAHLDFDYGDEEMLSRLAAVSRRRGAAALLVGRAAYALVIVPPMRTVRSSTLKLLEEFRAAGGLVVFAGAPADHVDAAPSGTARELAAGCITAPASGPGLVSAAEKGGRRVSVLDPSGTEIRAALCLLREDRGAWYLFLCITGLTDEDRARHIFALPPVRDRTLSFPLVSVRAWLAAEGVPLELDPRTGGSWAARARRAPSGAWEISTSLPALGSRLFLFPKQADAGAAGTGAPVELEDALRTEMADGRWTITRSEDNVLVLDRPSFRIGSGPWQGPSEVLRADSEIRAAIGCAPRGGSMIQPWARPTARGGSRGKRRARGTQVQLLYEFAVEVAVSGALFLAIESPERWTLSLNGQTIAPDTECGWWVDPSLRRLPLDPSVLRHGLNELLLSGTYDEDHPGLEIIYLLGDFGVDVRGGKSQVVDVPRSLALGDWTAQGLAFYSGSVCYERRVSVERGPGDLLFVQVPEYRGVAVRVLVDGKPAGVIGWEPNEVDITDHVPLGASTPEIRIEVVGHRRNSHGPLHHASKWPAWTGPGEFRSVGADWTDAFQLVPCGLLKPPAIVVRRPVREN